MATVVVVVSSALALSMAYLFRSGYPYQCTVLAVQQLVCTVFASVAMSWNPEDAVKLRISKVNYVTMLLPFSGVLSLKLFLQNKAVQYVSPAFYAMTGSLLPVGVTALPSRWAPPSSSGLPSPPPSWFPSAACSSRLVR